MFREDNKLIDSSSIDPFIELSGEKLPGRITNPLLREKEFKRFIDTLNENTVATQLYLKCFDLADDEAIRLFKAIKSMSSIEYITFYDFTFDYTHESGSNKTRALAELIQESKTLTGVALRRCNLCDYDIVILVKALIESHFIDTVDLRDNRFHNAGAKELIHLLESNPRINELKFSDSYHFDGGGFSNDETIYIKSDLLEEISELLEKNQETNLLKQSAYKNLNLFGNDVIRKIQNNDPSITMAKFDHLSRYKMKKLVEAFKKNTYLTSLVLDNCNSIHFAEYISEIIQFNRSIQEMTITHCDINNTGIGLICMAMMYNHHSLISLNISNNKIGNEGLKFLSLMLKFDQSLRKLNLSDNEIENEGYDYLCTTLKNDNRSLQELKFSGMNAHLAKKFEEVLIANEFIIDLGLDDKQLEEFSLRELLENNKIIPAKRGMMNKKII